ncbi:MAG: AMP-binding protein [Alphaproteobacteria bacterium]|nr:AMP-binding protein [Alphaproteobacteria bacterium]
MPASRLALALRPLLACLEEACRHPAGHAAMAGTAGRLSRPDFIGIVRRVAAAVQRRVPAGARVAAFLPQTPQGVAALLGCASAGRVCVVLNPADPPERLRLMLEDAAPAAVLFDDALALQVPWPAGAGAVAIALSDCLAGDGDVAAVPHDPDAPSMIHYTSGSTGRPKGIVLSSFNVMARASMMIERQGMTEADRYLIPTTISDGSCVAAHIAGVLCGGTQLVVSFAAEGPGGVVRLAAREGATILAGPTAMLRALRGLAAMPQAVARPRLLRIGGSGLPADDLAAWRALLPAGCGISHSYASTEAMVVSDWSLPIERVAQGGTLSVGRMLPGVEYALLDEEDRPVAEGEAGHMVLRGRQLALGELQEGRVVPGRMLPDPALPGARVFRTGDVLRRAADGLLYFAGRADRQMKVNGVRLEPAEIEAVLRAEDGVRDAALVQLDDGSLHGFVAVPERDWAEVQPLLIARLRDSVPTAMRPRRLHVLPALPLLPSAKHDLAALRRLAQLASQA